MNKSLLVCAALAAAAVSSRARAELVTSSWVAGDVQASWHSAARWSNGIPNNSGSTTYQAIINSVSPDAGPLVTLTQTTLIDSLTLGPRAQVRLDSLAPLRVANGINGAGTIQLSFENALTGLNSPLTIGSGITVNVGGGTIGLQDQPLDNYGKIVGGGIVAGNPIRNHGQLQGSIFLGTYSLASLGQLTGSSYKTVGTLLNDGATLSVRAGTPSWQIGGTIQGGTIETGDGRTIHVPYFLSGPGFYSNIPRLDNVVMNADLVVDNNRLTIVNGNLIGNGSVMLYPLAGTINASVQSDTSTLTIGAGITIRSGGSSTPGFGAAVGTPGSFSSSLINHGTLRADPPMLSGYTHQELDLFGTSIFNDGTLVVGRDGTIIAARDIQSPFMAPTAMTFGLGGMLDVTLSPNAGWGLFQVGGTLDLTTSGDSLVLATSVGIQPNTFYRIALATEGITGQFNVVSPDFEIEFRNGNTELWARFVPEPASATLVLSMLAILRRKRK